MKKLIMLTALSMSLLLVACASNTSEIPAPADNTTVPVNPSTGEITVDQATEIALQHANLAAEQVSFVRSEREFDNGIEKYDIEFYMDDKEYDYEIDAKTGEIMSYDYDVENFDIFNQAGTNAAANEEQFKITVDEAKEIVLKHANFTNEQVGFAKAERDMDDGIAKYDIEFYVDNIEYNYEIDARDGKILGFKQD